MGSRVIAAVLVLGLATAAIGDEPPEVTTAAEVAKLDRSLTTVRVKGVGFETIDALAKRLPNLTKLVLYEPSNKIDARALHALGRFPKLTDLTLSGDPFLYEREFAALGRLRQLRSLRLALL